MTSYKYLCLLILVVNASISSSFVYSDEDEPIPYSTIRMRRRLFAKRRHRNICNLENDEKNDEKLREVVAGSDFVFTGKVVNYHHGDLGSGGGRSVEKRDGEKREKRRRLKKPARGKSRNKSSHGTGTRNPDDNNRSNQTAVKISEQRNSIEVNLSLEGDEKPEMFVVEIKRVIKGAHQLAGIDKVIVKVPKEFVSGMEITSDPRLNRNCIEFHPVLKIRQTAILLAKKLNVSGYLELTYFPVAMTLRHLDRVDAAVTGRISNIIELYEPDTESPSRRELIHTLTPTLQVRKRTFHAVRL